MLLTSREHAEMAEQILTKIRNRGNYYNFFILYKANLHMRLAEYLRAEENR